MEQCPPCVMAIHRNGRIETLQHTCRFDGAVAPALLTGGTLSAHGRTDPATGERIHVSYRTDEPPCLCVDTFDPYWKRRRPQVTVELSAPIMLHDVCITPRHTCTVLFDFPLASVPIGSSAVHFPSNTNLSTVRALGCCRRGRATTKHRYGSIVCPVSFTWYQRV